MTVPFFRGQLIEYTLPHGENVGEFRPAVVTEIVSEEDMICNLVVSKGKANDFTGPPNQFVANVTYDGSKALGTWHQTMCFHGGSTATCSGEETSDGSADQAVAETAPAEVDAISEETGDGETADAGGTDKKTSEEVDS